MKIKFTDEQRAAILAGGTEIEVDAETLAGTKPSVKPAGPDAEALAAAAAAEAAAVAAAAAAAAAAATVPAASAAPAPSADLLSHLKEENATLRAQNLASQVELTGLKDSTTAAVTASAGLVAIARDSVSVMQIALGGSSTTETMGAQDVVAEHARVQPLFKAKFKMSGVAAASIDAGPSGNVIPLNPEFAARLASMPSK